MENQKTVFDKLYLEFSTKVFRLCLAYTNDENLSNDLMQDCFVKVWQHLPSFRGESAYSTWIYRIAANTCLTYLRKDKPETNKELNPDIIPDVHEKHHVEEQIATLYKCIYKLEPPDKLVITMVLEEVSHKEIAEALGITENNVGVKVHRIKKQLLQCYNKYEGI